MLKAKFYHTHVNMPAVPHGGLGIYDLYRAAREEGHVRLYKDNEVPDLSGVTVCHLVDDNDVRVATGYAFCSAKDQFCKRTGRRIAEGRARKRLAEIAWALAPVGSSEHATEFDASVSTTMGYPDATTHEEGTPR